MVIGSNGDGAPAHGDRYGVLHGGIAVAAQGCLDGDFTHPGSGQIALFIHRTDAGNNGIDYGGVALPADGGKGNRIPVGHRGRNVSEGEADLHHLAAQILQIFEGDQILPVVLTFDSPLNVGVVGLNLDFGVGGEGIGLNQVEPFAVTFHVLDLAVVDTDLYVFGQFVGQIIGGVTEGFAGKGIVAGKKNAVFINGNQISFVILTGGYVNGGITEGSVHVGPGRSGVVEYVLPGDAEVVLRIKSSVGMSAEVNHVGVILQDLEQFFGGAVSFGHISVPVLRPFGAGGLAVLVHTEAAFQSIVMEHQINVTVSIGLAVISFKNLFQPDKLIGRQMLVHVGTAVILQSADPHVNIEIAFISNGVIVIGIILGKGNFIFVIFSGIICVGIGLDGVFRILKSLRGRYGPFLGRIGSVCTVDLVKIPGQNIVVAQSDPQGEGIPAVIEDIGNSLILVCHTAGGNVAGDGNEGNVCGIKQFHGGGKSLGDGMIRRRLGQVRIGQNAVRILQIPGNESAGYGNFIGTDCYAVHSEPQMGDADGNGGPILELIGQSFVIDGKISDVNNLTVAGKNSGLGAPVKLIILNAVFFGENDRHGTFRKTGDPLRKFVLHSRQPGDGNGVGLLGTVGQSHFHGPRAGFRCGSLIDQAQGNGEIGQMTGQSVFKSFRGDIIGSANALQIGVQCGLFCGTVDGNSLIGKTGQHGIISFLHGPIGTKSGIFGSVVGREPIHDRNPGIFGGVNISAGSNRKKAGQTVRIGNGGPGSKTGRNDAAAGSAGNIGDYGRKSSCRTGQRSDLTHVHTLGRGQICTLRIADDTADGHVIIGPGSGAGNICGVKAVFNDHTASASVAAQNTADAGLTDVHIEGTGNHGHVFDRNSGASAGPTEDHAGTTVAGHVLVYVEVNVFENNVLNGNGRGGPANQTPAFNDPRRSTGSTAMHPLDHVSLTVDTAGKLIFGIRHGIVTNAVPIGVGQVDIRGQPIITIQGIGGIETDLPQFGAVSNVDHGTALHCGNGVIGIQSGGEGIIPLLQSPAGRQVFIFGGIAHFPGGKKSHAVSLGRTQITPIRRRGSAGHTVTIRNGGAGSESTRNRSAGDGTADVRNHGRNTSCRTGQRSDLTHVHTLGHGQILTLRIADDTADGHVIIGTGSGAGDICGVKAVFNGHTAVASVAAQNTADAGLTDVHIEGTGNHGHVFDRNSGASAGPTEDHAGTTVAGHVLVYVEVNVFENNVLNGNGRGGPANQTPAFNDPRRSTGSTAMHPLDHVSLTVDTAGKLRFAIRHGIVTDAVPIGVGQVDIRGQPIIPVQGIGRIETDLPQFFSGIDLDVTFTECDHSRDPEGYGEKNPESHGKDQKFLPFFHNRTLLLFYCM